MDFDEEVIKVEVDGRLANEGERTNHEIDANVDMNLINLSESPPDTTAAPSQISKVFTNGNSTKSNGEDDILTSSSCTVQQQLQQPKVNFHLTDALSSEEEQKTKEFLEIINGARAQKNINPLSWNAGVKFLMARRFDVRRAIELYQQHHITRVQEGLINFDASTEPFKTELLSGKFTVLPSRDLGGASICLFSARLHQPSSVPQEHTLKSVVYQLDAELENPLTQRNGLVFVYDMTDSKYSHFDYDLSIKMLSLLKGGYPARLKKVLIVTAPLWFRAPFRILRLFVREKLRDRVFTVSLPQLAAHIPLPALPKKLGGHLEVDHHLWLAKCYSILDCTDLWGISSEEPFIEMASSGSNTSNDSDDKNSISNGHHSISKESKKKGSSTPSHIPNSSGSSGFSDDPDENLPYEEKTGLTLLNFIEHVKQKGRRGLMDEYAEIISKNPDGSFNASKQRGNISKNRYSDVLCLDHTRVILTGDGDSSESNDYINANFVDGYKQKNAFISTQGPLPRTFGDFWKMIWEQKVLVIVMTTRAVERGRTKCGQYWPPDKSSSVCHEGFRLENKDVESSPDYVLTRLRLIEIKTGDARNVVHLQFLSWPDYGVPSSAKAMLAFLLTMRQEQSNGWKVMEKSSAFEGNVPPIVVHCSAGIGRTGTLCTIDICTRRLQDQGTVDVLGTVEKIRSQRAHSIQVPEQYLFCHQAVLEYSRAHNLITQEQLESVPDLLQEGDSDSE